MNAEAFDLVSAGWALDLAIASGWADEGACARFHVVARGEDFGNPARGVVAVVARADAPGREALEAVQVAVQQFVEGLYSAPATLSSGRAAEHALSAVNAWLFAQPHHEALTLSLSAAILSNGRVGCVHVGQCAIFRRRAGQTTRLTTPHLRRLDADHFIPSRAVGAEPEVRIDFVDLAVSPGDRFLLLTDAADRGSENLGDLSASAEKLASDIAAGQSLLGSLVFVAVEAAPEISYDDLAAQFSNLPLRPPPRDGEVWDGFEILRTVHRSRWSVLKLARDRDSGDEVVLKIPLPATLNDNLFRAGFLREAWVGRLVASPFVSKPVELAPDRATSLYLVLPFHKGETLAERIGRKPALSVVESIDIVAKLSAGVESLLARQIVHRDIKPENVILSPDGGVTLIDLGMAYLPAIDGPAHREIGGSTHYMAPELFQGATADARTEVFAIAVTLYRILTGDYPFSGRDVSLPPVIPPRIPDWLGAILTLAMSPVPQIRPAGPAEFAHLIQEGLVRGDSEPQDRRRRWRKPNSLEAWRAAAILFAAAFAALLIYDALLRR